MEADTLCVGWLANSIGSGLKSVGQLACIPVYQVIIIFSYIAVISVLLESIDHNVYQWASQHIN